MCTEASLEFTEQILEADGIQQHTTGQVTIVSAEKHRVEAAVGADSPKLDN